ncbi:hypothetical protein TWF192_004570 [Orbilia oligospora]|uniref:Uncharacterized protein n=1 Tax=Orbilia oligospora TaxID=2813651 RepID=A0A6G1MB93_ORBOL|nr:hypothetical protein TWF191_011373 [Orbilia oligospora]KAF3252117.1 hypothetical protein TWF192_004570 [Orbilia oligospora]
MYIINVIIFWLKGSHTFATTQQPFHIPTREVTLVPETLQIYTILKFYVTMKTLYLLPAFCAAPGLSFRVDIQWGTSNPLTQDLRSFQPESELWNKTAPRFQESFTIETDRTHNRMEKACKEITQPYTQVKDRENRDYLRRHEYVKAVRISQTPQIHPPNQEIPPFKHPYERSVRGIAFFGNGNCKGEPKLIIWPKQAADMNYPTARRYEILRSPTEVENFYTKWAQTFEFSDFDVKKDPNSHYNVAKPQLEYLRDPTNQKKVDKQLKKYPENPWLKKGTLGSPVGSPYHQPFGSFREIFPTRSDRIWRQIVSPTGGDTSYWNIPMINVQLDHRNTNGQQKADFFRSFVPYGLLDSTWAAVFELIEQEYARFYRLMVDLLGVPGKSPVKRIRWSPKRQAAALKNLASAFDPRAPFYTEAIRSLERALDASPLSKLRNFEVYTTSPNLPSPREWTLPPSWEGVPVWNASAGRMVKNPKTGEMERSGAYGREPNPNRIIYSSVQLEWLGEGRFKFTTVPVVSDPTAAIVKEAALEELSSIEEEAVIEQLPLIEEPLNPVVENIPENEQLPVKINTGADLRTASGIEEEKKIEAPQIGEGQEISSPLLSPAGGAGRSGFAFPQQTLPISDSISDAGTAGSLSELASSIVNYANRIDLDESYEIIAPDVDIGRGKGQQNQNLQESIVSRPRSRGGVSGERPQPQIESLKESRILYRPQDDPLLQSKSSMRQSRSGRISAPNSIGVLKEIVVSYRPPPAQNLRENILRASQHPSANGDIVVPIGNDLSESIVVNSKQRRGQNSPAAAAGALSKSSGTAQITK